MMAPNMYETLLIAVLISQTLVLFIVSWGVWQYIRLQRWLDMMTKYCRRVIMNSDEILNQLLLEEEVEGPAVVAQTSTTNYNADTSGGACRATSAETLRRKRDRLAALTAGGKASQYLGKNTSTDQIDEMSEDEVNHLYARYEGRLGAKLTKTLGNSCLQLYAMAAGTVLPIPKESQPKLVADLEEDPFVEHALSGFICELYHRYGMFLAPLTAALTTARHCRFGQDVVLSMISNPSEQKYDGPARDDADREINDGVPNANPTPK